MSGLDDWLPKDETEPFFGTPETRISAEELLKTWEKSAQESMDYERKYENELLSHNKLIARKELKNGGPTPETYVLRLKRQILALQLYKIQEGYGPSTDYDSFLPFFGGIMTEKSIWLQIEEVKQEIERFELEHQEKAKELNMKLIKLLGIDQKDPVSTYEERDRAMSEEVLSKAAEELRRNSPK